MRNRGFSLVELSVVVLIIGIVLTMGLGALNASREGQSSSTTTQKQTALKEALISYLRRNLRLPCPDTDFTAPDGVENRTTPGNPATACSAAFGLIPYVTLGVAQDMTQDGWGYFFSYHVSNNAAANTDWTLTASMRSGNTGVITVNDRNGATVTATGAGVVAVIVSHGKNGFGAYAAGGTRNTLPAVGTDERDNTDTNTTYFKRTGTTDDAATGGAFDDIVMYVTADDLLGPLFKDGTLKPPAAGVQEALLKIKNAMIGYGMASLSIFGTSTCASAGPTPRCRLLVAGDTFASSDGVQDAGTTSGVVPYSSLGLSLSDATDPWGVRYAYSVTSSLLNQGISSAFPTSTTVAFTLSSYGPDRVAGGGDDISISFSVAEIRPLFAGLIP